MKPKIKSADAVDPYDDIYQRERVEIIYELMECLTAKQLQVILWVYIDHRKLSHVAKALGIAVPTAHQYMKAGTKKMAKLALEKGYCPRDLL